MTDPLSTVVGKWLAAGDAGTMTADFGGLAATGRAFRMDQAVIAHLREGKVAEAREIADIAAVQADGPA